MDPVSVLKPETRERMRRVVRKTMLSRVSSAESEDSRTSRPSRRNSGTASAMAAAQFGAGTLNQNNPAFMREVMERLLEINTKYLLPTLAEGDDEEDTFVLHAYASADERARQASLNQTLLRATEAAFKEGAHLDTQTSGKGNHKHASVATSAEAMAAAAYAVSAAEEKSEAMHDSVSIGSVREGEPSAVEAAEQPQAAVRVTPPKLKLPAPQQVNIPLKENVVFGEFFFLLNSFIVFDVVCVA
jgi:hypothetical protein